MIKKRDWPAAFFRGKTGYYSGCPLKVPGPLGSTGPPGQLTGSSPCIIIIKTTPSKRL